MSAHCCNQPQMIGRLDAGSFKRHLTTPWVWVQPQYMLRQGTGRRCLLDSLTALAAGAPRVVERMVEVPTDEALMERIRGEMKAEIEAKVSAWSQGIRRLPARFHGPRVLGRGVVCAWMGASIIA